MHNDFLYENTWVAQLSSAGSELGWEGIIEMSAPFDGNISLSAVPFACANLLRLSVYYPAVHFSGTVQDLADRGKLTMGQVDVLTCHRTFWSFGGKRLTGYTFSEIRLLRSHNVNLPQGVFVPS